jgi:hypothetical protein
LKSYSIWLGENERNRGEWNVNTNKKTINKFDIRLLQ